MYLHTYELKEAYPLDDFGFEITEMEATKLEDTYRTESITNSTVLTPYIERVIKAYGKAVDESNHIGLNSLFEAYGKYDTYFTNFGEYAYVTNGGFSVEPIGRKGNEIACIVTQQMKERAKGTYMTMPSYINKYLVKVKLCEDDKLRIVSLATLSTHLIGEPLSMIRNVTGISDKISYNEAAFTTANQLAVEKVIQEFTVKLLDTKGTMGADVYDIIDMGISKTEKNSLEKYFKTLSELNTEKSYIWLTGYDSKSNVYVKAKLREVYICENNNYTVESHISLAYRNDKWSVVSYVIDFAVEEDKNEKISSTGALIVNDKSKTGTERSILNTSVGNATGETGGYVQEQTNETWDNEVTQVTVTEDEEAETTIQESKVTEQAETEVEVTENVFEDIDEDPLAGLFD